MIRKYPKKPRPVSLTRECLECHRCFEDRPRSEPEDLKPGPQEYCSACVKLMEERILQATTGQLKELNDYRAELRKKEEASGRKNNRLGKAAPMGLKDLARGSRARHQEEPAKKRHMVRDYSPHVYKISSMRKSG